MILNSSDNRFETDASEKGEQNPALVSEMAVDAAANVVDKVASHHPAEVRKSVVREIALLLRPLIEAPARRSGAVE